MLLCCAHLCACACVCACTCVACGGALWSLGGCRACAVARVTRSPMSHVGRAAAACRRKAELQAQRAAGGKLGAPQHFLDTLLMATDEAGQPLSDDAVQEEVDTFLFEGAWVNVPVVPVLHVLLVMATARSPPCLHPHCTHSAPCARPRHDRVRHHVGAVLHRLLPLSAAAPPRGN